MLGSSAQAFASGGFSLSTDTRCCSGSNAVESRRENFLYTQYQGFCIRWFRSSNQSNRFSVIPKRPSKPGALSRSREKEEKKQGFLTEARGHEGRALYPRQSSAVLEQARESRKSARMQGRVGSPSRPKLQARMRRLPQTKSSRKTPRPDEGINDRAGNLICENVGLTPS